MAVVITPVTNPVLITATDSVDSTVNLDSFIEESEAIAEISKITSTSVKFNGKGAIGANAATFLAADLPVGTRLRLSVKKGFPLHYQATTGNETFIINVIKGTA